MAPKEDKISETPMSADWRQWYYHTGHVVESVLSCLPRGSEEFENLIESRTEMIGQTREQRWSRPGD